MILATRLCLISRFGGKVEDSKCASVCRIFASGESCKSASWSFNESAEAEVGPGFGAT